MRWNVSWFNALRGTPNELIGDENIEGKVAPHASADEELEKVADGAEVEAPIIPLSMRLTKDICKTYGYTVNCPRCRFYQHGRESMRKSDHSAACREKMYDSMRKAGDIRLKVPEAEKEPDQVPVLQKAAIDTNGTLDDVPRHAQVDVPIPDGVDGQSDEQMEDARFDADMVGDPSDDVGMDIDVLCNALIVCGVKVVDANRAAIQMIKQEVVAQLAEMP